MQSTSDEPPQTLNTQSEEGGNQQAQQGLPALPGGGDRGRGINKPPLVAGGSKDNNSENEPQEPPARFGDPGKAAWENTVEYFRKKDERVSPELFPIVREGLVMAMFPPSDADPASQEEWRRFRERYKFTSPEDSRIDAAARIYLGATHAVEMVTGLVGIPFSLTTELLTSTQGHFIAMPAFIDNDTTHPAMISYSFKKKDGTHISAKDITAENVQECSLDAISIIFNMWYIIAIKAIRSSNTCSS